MSRLCHTPLPTETRYKAQAVTDTISFIQEQGVATLSFDNPARRNALGAVELWKQNPAALAERWS